MIFLHAKYLWGAALWLKYFLYLGVYLEVRNSLRVCVVRKNLDFFGLVPMSPPIQAWTAEKP